MKTTAGLKKPLTGKETTALMDYVCGQNSDEYGEGLEQRPIKTPDGEIYVSFWNNEMLRVPVNRNNSLTDNVMRLIMNVISLHCITFCIRNVRLTVQTEQAMNRLIGLWGRATKRVAADCIKRISVGQYYVPWVCFFYTLRNDDHEWSAIREIKRRRKANKEVLSAG